MIVPRVILAFGLLAGNPGAWAEEPLVFAITNARIVPVSGPQIEKGSVVIRDGIIEAVGAGVVIPSDARVIDAAGLFVYPGLIDALSDIGLEPRSQPAAPARSAGVAPPVPQQAQQQPSQTPEERQGLTPYRRASDLLNPTSSKIERARAAGITAALVAPGGGIFSGQSCLVNLSGADTGRMVVKTPVAFHVNMPAFGGFSPVYPGSLMGVFAFVKQTLLDSQHYGEAWRIYAGNPGAARPQYSRALEALQSPVAGKTPVVFPGSDSVEIRRMMDIAEAFRLDLVISGAGEAGPVAAELRERKIPVLLSVKYPERERESAPDAKEELTLLRRRVEAPGTAAILAKAGVRFAFQSADMENPRDFVRNVGKAVEAGLDKDAALRALTLTPAEIFGVADRLGSIEPKKTANLIVATGDIFDASTRIKFSFIDGRKYEITEIEPAPTREGAAAPPQTAGNATGTWSLTITTPQGPMEVTLKLQQQGETVTGTALYDMGEATIVDGRFAECRLTFRVSAGNHEASFSGTIQGDSLTGTFNAGEMGNLECRGSRGPREVE